MQTDAARPNRRGRGWLFAACLGLALTAPRWGVAAGNNDAKGPRTEVTGVGYGGVESSGWACGPIGRAQYAGGAASMRFSGRAPSPAEGRGLLLDARAAVQRMTVEIIDPRCDDDAHRTIFEEPSPPTPDERQSCIKEESVAPPDATLAAASVRAGYEWAYGGFQVGGGGFERWASHADGDPIQQLFPDVEGWGQAPGRWRVLLGLGRPLLTDLFRPALYTGADVAVGDGLLEVRAGQYLVQPAHGGALVAEAAWLAPVAPGLWVRVGASVGTPSATGSEPSLSGSLGLSAAFDHAPAPPASSTPDQPYATPDQP